MTNILIILNDPPYGNEHSTMQMLSAHTLNADKVLVL